MVKRNRKDGGDEAGPSAKRTRKSTMSAADHAKMCQDLYEILRTQKTEGGRLLCQAFIRAPSKRNCPEYYEVVEAPIDLMKMHQKLKSDEYENIDEFIADVQQMVNNAKTFYRRGCQEYRDACEIWEVIQDQKARLLEDDNQSDASAKSHESSPAPSMRSLRSNSPSRQSMRSKEGSPGAVSMAGQDFMDRPHLEEMLAGVLELTDETGRLLCDPYKLLPSPSQYPEYYGVIRDPIDLRTICRRLVNNEYRTMNALERDLVLMCKNAKAFNEPASLIYKDAVTIRKFVATKKAEVLENALSGVPPARSSSNAKRIADTAGLSSPNQREKIPTPQELGEDECEKDSEVDHRNPLWKLYMAIRNFRDHQTLALISEPFCKLPSTKFYPDYYEEIKNPMSLFIIKHKLRTLKYKTAADMGADLNLMFENAKAYNVEGSQIYESASTLQDYAMSQVERLEAGEEVEFQRSVQTGDGTSIPVKPVRRRRSVDSAAGENIKQKPGRKSMEQLMQRYRARLMSLYNAVYDYRDTTGRILAEPFIYKPSRKLYPEYYQVIPEPIDLKTIKYNIDADKYANIQALADDLQLMFNNARHFNEEGSAIFKDASMLEQLMTNTLAQIGTMVESPKVLKEKFGWYKTRSPSVCSGVGGTSQASPDAAARAAARTIRRRASTEDLSKQKMWRLYEAIKECADVHGRKLCTCFIKLPSKNEYPDYYEVIRKPIDMTRISQKLLAGQYDTLEALVQDFCQMCDNACRYNDPESLIYKDALTLQKVLLQMKTEMQREENDSGVPDVQAGVQELLLTLFVTVYNSHDTEGRCYSDSLADLHDVQRQVEPDAVPCLTLDRIKRNLDKGRYLRLDVFQDDFFEVLEKARHLSRSDSQLFEDSADLQLCFIRTRDELCKKGETFLSPALSYTERMFLNDLDEERREKMPQEEQEDAKGMQSANLAPSKLKDGEVQMESITIGNVVYKVGDFVYVKPIEEKPDPHILCIERIWRDDSLGKSFVNGCWYHRPHETYHLATRKFLEKEVFKSIFYDNVESSRLLGKCYVMFVRDYFNFKPKDFDDNDVYVCESQYLGRVRHFKKIKQWHINIDECTDMEFEEREEPLSCVRVPSVFVAGSVSIGSAAAAPSGEGSISKTEDDLDLDDGDFSIVDKEREEVRHADAPDDAGDVYYEQVFCNGLWIKLGDAVYVRNDEKEQPDIMRVDKIWKSKEGEAFASGPWFIRPCELDHEPTRMFYVRELFITQREDNVRLSLVIGKCVVMNLKDFCARRPTEIPEQDVYICESKVRNHNNSQTAETSDGGEVGSPVPHCQDSTRRMSKGIMKMHRLSPLVLDDEIYFFKKPITPEKEASPLLDKASKHEIDIDDLLANMEFPDGANPAMDMDFMNDSSTFSRSFSNVGSGSTPSTPIHKVSRSKSGYILFSAEVRKRVMSENPNCTFGEVSKMVGQEWRLLPETRKKEYEDRASAIAEQRAKSDAHRQASAEQTTVPGGQLRVYACRWRDCDYMFETSDQLYQHVSGAGGHTSQIVEVGDNQYVCLWYSCSKYKKDGKPFPSLPRLHRHIKDKHVPNAAKIISPSQKSRNFVPAPQAVVTTLEQSIGQTLPQNPAVVYSQPGYPGAQTVTPQGGAALHTGPPTPLVVYQMQQPPGQPTMPGGVAAGPTATAGQQAITVHAGTSVAASNVDPSSMVVHAPPRPVFVAPPGTQKVQRALHSEIYLKYIEGLYSGQETVSKFQETFATRFEPTPPPNMDRLKPSDWFVRPMETKKQAVNALWALKKHLLNDALVLSRL